MDSHPVLLEMHEHGCGNLTHVDLAFQVYMHLCEESRLWDVNHRYVPEMDLIVVSARRGKETETQVFLPIAASTQINLAWLDSIQEALGVRETEDSPSKLNLAVVDTDSTVVIHEMARGLVPPSSEKRTRRRRTDLATLLASELVLHATAAAASGTRTKPLNY